MCNHRTAIVAKRNKRWVYMLCTDICKQPYLMVRQKGGRYQEENAVAYFAKEGK